MKNHELKIDEEYLLAILTGEKTFEIRKNDRDFKTGDIVTLLGYKDGILSRWMPQPQYRIGYLTDYEQQAGYVVFSLKRLQPI
jgi:hypothetical protein